ncbi:MAG TPA: proton-conducting transporter membrane subunit [Phycisphaerales bacterium]|nr:proton-conducting transporter membrane subunit [Phycisphaerales bacterium]HMP36896.1 proton-conducting transporter membrane subunit [Phycisphaerales bacterium]
MLPILVPLLAAALALALPGDRAPRLVLLATALFLPLVALLVMVRVHESGAIVVHVGGWAAPFGIAIVADRFASIMVMLAAIVGAATVLFSSGEAPDPRTDRARSTLILALLAAAAGAFLAGDLFNLYVWFELLLVSSFGLAVLEGRGNQLAGGIVYVVLSLLSSTLFLVGAGLCYGAVGTLNLADLGVRLAELGNPRLATVLASPLLIAFAIKAAVVPFVAWLPAAYPPLSSAIGALFAGLLTKVGVYAIIRTSTIAFVQEPEVIGFAILTAAGATMALGVLAAVSQAEIRRILSFHIASQIGYMLMGTGLALVIVATTPSESVRAELATIALGGAILYILHHIIVKTNLFLVAGLIERRRGTTELKALGGLAQSDPAIAAIFLISALSLAGLPVFSGFWAKLVLVRAGLDAGAWIVTGIALATGLLTLLSMMKIWVEAFWREPVAAAPPPREPGPGWRPMLAASGALAAIALAIGLGARPAWWLARGAAEDMLARDAAAARVLEGGPETPTGERREPRAPDPEEPRR